MIQIKAPDGSIAQFPDGTPDGVITSVMAKTFGGPKSAPVESHPVQDAMEGFAAPFKSLGHEVMEQVRKPPVAPRSMADMLNSFMGPAKIAAGVANLSSAPVQAVTHPVAKALAAYGPAPTEGPHLTSNLSLTPARQLHGQEASDYIEGKLNTSVAGARPAGLDMAAALAAHAPPPVPEPPSVGELRAQSSALYDKARASGVVVKPEAFKTFATDLQAKLDGEGLDATLQPRTTATLKRIANTSGPVDLSELDNLRKISTNAAGGTLDKSDRRLARIVTDEIDNFVGTLKPADVASGDPAAANATLTQARDLWQRQAKGQQIEDMIAKAKGNPNGVTGYDTALRAQFRKLANNPRGMASFSKTEQAAIQKVANGGPVGEALYQLGKLAPTDPYKQGFEALLATMPGHTGAIMAGVGIPAKVASTLSTSRNAKLASALMRRGSGP